MIGKIIFYKLNLSIGHKLPHFILYLAIVSWGTLDKGEDVWCILFLVNYSGF